MGDESSTEQWLREFRAWVQSHSTDTPLLSDEGISRDAIYGNRVMCLHDCATGAAVQNSNIVRLGTRHSLLARSSALHASEMSRILSIASRMGKTWGTKTRPGLA